MDHAEWICSDWEQAHNGERKWKDICDYLYGAMQVCIWIGAMDDEDDYRMLLWIARDHRFSESIELIGVAA